ISEHDDVVEGSSSSRHVMLEGLLDANAKQPVIRKPPESAPCRRETEQERHMHLLGDRRCELECVQAGLEIIHAPGVGGGVPFFLDRGYPTRVERQAPWK